MLKDDRMKCICSLVTEGGTVCDVGTDHAFVPIELVQSGHCKRAVITDISRPSLEKGLENVRKNGLSNSITGYCCNGTSGVDLSGVTDVIIAGMGGELIISIIDGDFRLQSEKIHLILQPMSRAPELRKHLFTHGFETKPELRVRSDGRLYTVISARFTGQNTECTARNLYLGINPLRDELGSEYIEHVVKNLKTKKDGLMCGGKEAEAREVENLINSILG